MLQLLLLSLMSTGCPFGDDRVSFDYTHVVVNKNVSNISDINLTKNAVKGRTHTIESLSQCHVAEEIQNVKPTG